MLFNKMSQEKIGLIKRLDLLSGGLLSGVHCTVSAGFNESSRFNESVFDHKYFFVS